MIKVTIVGIDLGQKGGIATMHCNFANLDGEFGSVYTEPLIAMPVKQDGRLDVEELNDILCSIREKQKCWVYFEDITTLHSASKSSNLSLGKQSGAVEGICVANIIPFTKVPPKEWQAEMFKDLPPLRKKNGTSDTKGLAFIAAKKYFPHMKIQKSKDGLTDALLIAEYGRGVYNK